MSNEPDDDQAEKNEAKEEGKDQEPEWTMNDGDGPADITPPTGHKA